MRRIGIHTITDYVNYGNRLQNYAVQEILKSLGFEVESIVNYPVRPVDDNRDFFLSRFKNAIKLSPLTLFKKLVQKINDRRTRELDAACKQRKATSFKKFSEKHIAESSFTLTLNHIPPHLDERYDYCVVGSDQIWNPNIRYGSSLDFLSYVAKEKRVALAPSIGVSVIPVKYNEIYRRYINEMAFLSVREEKGAELIRELCGRDAELLVDPTITLTSEHWDKLATRASGRPLRKYLLTYFIGEVSRSRFSALQKLAAQEGLELVLMNSLKQPDRYDADPAEFLDYIRSAELVCTDSFHCIIFSMHFRRPFVVFEREGKSAPMGSRIDTLLNKFGFTSRRAHELQHTGHYFNIDFSHIEEIMKTEREKVYRYLKEALSVDEIQLY